MPEKPGKGTAQLINKYQAYVGGMTGPKTRGAMAVVLSIGLTGAKELAPIEYSTLVNSSFERIEDTSSGVRGLAGFTVYYAYYLHENTHWKPRPPHKKKGPAWNPNAKPKFLERGFTDSAQQALMKTALKDAYK